MVPPVETVLRRRHITLMALRACALGLIVYGLIGDQGSIGNVVLSIRNGPFIFGTIVDVLTQRVRYVVPGIILALASRQIARWVVPAGLRMDGCPACGYSLRNLKSPICPECGADIGTPGRAGRR